MHVLAATTETCIHVGSGASVNVILAGRAILVNTKPVIQSKTQTIATITEPTKRALNTAHVILAGREVTVKHKTVIQFQAQTIATITEPTKRALNTAHVTLAGREVNVKHKTVIHINTQTIATITEPTQRALNTARVILAGREVNVKHNVRYTTIHQAIATLTETLTRVLRSAHAILTIRAVLVKHRQAVVHLTVVCMGTVAPIIVYIVIVSPASMETGVKKDKTHAMMSFAYMASVMPVMTGTRIESRRIARVKGITVETLALT